MNKRPYTPPTIVRVKLEHQQAVLAACSTTTASLSTSSSSLRCQPSTATTPCRKSSTSGGRDSNATS